MSGGRFDTLAQALRQSYDYKLGINAAGESALPDRETVARICSSVLALMFPGYFRREDVSAARIDQHLQLGLAELETALSSQVVQALRFELRARGEAAPPNLAARSREKVDDLLADLVAVRELLVSDVEAAYANDPAAANRETIVVSYPCIEALAVQRFAHRLYQRGVPLIPRMMTELVHSHTGIDIHPGARLGESCFIDHGTGVVIGETAVLGKRCVLYQGVGLIAWNPLAKGKDGELPRGQANRRHPTVEDHVTLYAGATVLGGDTVIGHHSVIGGNVWLTHSVEPYSVVTIKDPELNIRTKTKKA
ncbi:MAG: serine acetyltransferase [Planctomycetes bacterium]|nr:serine acetyltransferase [Planctomycetota bacterium]